MDPEFDREFLQYLIEQGKYTTLLSDYLVHANKSSMGMIDVITLIMEEIITARENPLICKEFLENSMFIDAVFSTKVPQKIKHKLQLF